MIGDSSVSVPVPALTASAQTARGVARPGTRPGVALDGAVDEAARWLEARRRTWETPR